MQNTTEIDPNAMDVDDNRNFTLTPSPPPPPIESIYWVSPPSAAEASSTGVYGLYGDSDGLWVTYNWKKDSPDARIEPFYNRWPPSRTSSRWCSWISVNCGLSPSIQNLPSEELEKRFRRDVVGLKTEFDAIRAKGGQVTPEMIDALAIKYGVLSGKWMVYSKPEAVDQLWRKIVRVVAFDRGYGQVKVSARKVLDSNEHGAQEQEGGVPVPDEGHVTCVYVEDYTNRQEVDELRKALRFRASVFWKIGFKPDVYTYLGIYKGNEWGLRPSRYHDSDNDTGGYRRSHQ
ncbi:hypothetical protein NP233_g8747 [Leucocoprinus birnbaumii]|uniref:Uncharacterized protein n=1 Tax=Leucocoprinus birnbaumii TaxID=56174 RepID=A0AAD5VP58_9AGAR|nr:hypothetical protein NP233_g8747 [Leucocoprinus birnbaumii]